MEMRFVDKESIKHADWKVMGAHRDDHYIFFFVEDGFGRIMIDFAEVELTERSVYYILPGQVHHYIESVEGSGWFIAIDTLLVPEEYRAIFENHLLLHRPSPLDDTRYRQCATLIRLLNEHYISDATSPFYTGVLHAMLNAFIGFVACGYSNNNPAVNVTGRSHQIVQGFKRLLLDHVRIEKSPSWYAAQLNISESYLNEALKKVTGFSVTYWIVHEIMLEAKRLLYHSKLNVKEIAHDLGYEDHTYFSRIFKKSAGITPLAFRADSRK
jgi:AraC family transcriptional activator of pobA